MKENINDRFNEELMHYGVLGMRWGHRKAKPAAKSKQKYVSRNQTDIALYGQRGANRIEKHMAKRNYTHQQAVGREICRQMMTGMLASLAVPFVMADVGSKGRLHKTFNKACVNSGKKAVDRILNGVFDGAVLDANGKVIRRYRTGGVKIINTMKSIAG